MSFLDPVLNPVLQPLLNSSPFLVVLLLALVVSLLITLAYKFFSDQAKMKALKEEQKAYQQQMKELRSQPEKMMQMQKESMRKNMDYMKLSFKPMLFTMIPLFLFFGWMADHLAFEPIFPGETYSITATFAKGVTGDAELLVDEGTELLSEAVQQISDRTITWRLKSTEGRHEVKVKKGEQEWAKDVLITTAVQYEKAVSPFPHADLENIQIDYTTLRPAGPNFSLLGWKPTWLGWYVLFSIVFSIGLRKALKVY